MKKTDKKVMKDILQHRNLEQNLPAYAGAYMDAVYEYSLIRLVLNYYTVKEVADDRGGIWDAFLSGVMSQIHTILFQTVLAKASGGDMMASVREIHNLRESMTEKMTILTAYTDTLQIYEYVLNRIEYGITEETYPVETDELAAKVFQYLFAEQDKMVINSKIQMVTGQLPVRMTKNKFYDYLADTLNIYIGSDCSSVDDFVSMLESTAMLTLPDGYYDAYPDIVKLIQILEHTQFTQLDKEAYQALMEQFSFTAGHLTELVSDYLLVMEIINDLYAALLALPYQHNEENGTAVCLSMLKGLHDAFLANGEIPEAVDDGFMQIEGLQEMLGEDVMQYEGILPDILTQQEDMIAWQMSGQIFENLSMIAKLLSNSLFIDLSEKEMQEKPADADYIAQKREELIKLLSGFFDQHPKEINRAVMAAMFSNMPVLFNSQQEIKDYIEYSLNHCSSQSELMACAKILEDMMEE